MTKGERHPSHLVGVRLDPAAWQALQERAGTAHGRAGGVSLLIRRLIYEYLGLPMPVQHGDLGRSSRKRPRARRRQKPAASTDET